MQILLYRFLRQRKSLSVPGVCPSFISWMKQCRPFSINDVHFSVVLDDAI